MCEFGTYSCGFFLILQDKLQNAINVMKRIITALIIIIASLTAYAQMPGFGKKPSAATWKSRIEMTGDKSGKLILTMTAGKGWHIYGFDVEAGGPKAMTADFSKSTGIEFKGEFFSGFLTIPARIALSPMLRSVGSLLKSLFEASLIP